MKNAAENPSDSVSVQMKNTKAQVVGTWQKLSSTFRQAGKKVTGAVSEVKGKFSSKK
jgi:hypothetical protein